MASFPTGAKCKHPFQIYPQALNPPKIMANHSSPLIKKKRNPPIPNRRSQVFKSFCSMFSGNFYPFSWLLLLFKDSMPQFCGVKACLGTPKQTIIRYVFSIQSIYASQFFSCYHTGIALCYDRFCLQARSAQSCWPANWPAYWSTNWRCLRSRFRLFSKPGFTDFGFQLHRAWLP